jgi:hypothetical protein
LAKLKELAEKKLKRLLDEIFWKFGGTNSRRKIVFYMVVYRNFLSINTNILVEQYENL